MVYFRHMRGGQLISGRSVRLWPRNRRFLTAPRAGGYTVIEVLIVLAVTGALFVSAAIMIAGRQNRTAFEQAVRNVQSQIQSAIDEVVVGHYPNNGDIECIATGSGPSISVGTTGQGANGDCIFMGKVIQFAVGGTDPEQFKAYTVAGLRLNAGDDDVQLRTEARPRLVVPDLAYPGILTSILESGLTTVYVEYGSTAAQVGGVAIWQSLAPSGAGSLTSNAQSVHIGPVTGTVLGMGQQQFIDAANTTIATSPVDDPSGVRLCFVSGNTEQSGLVTLGGTNRNLTVRLDMKSNRTCA